MKAMSRDKSSRALAEAVSWYAAAVLLALMLVLSCCRCCWCCCVSSDGGEFTTEEMENTDMDRDSVVGERPCDEIYVVGEGETLQTIMEKCGDPYIVEENPHIHDPDEVFPGLIIKITPFNHR